MDHSPWSMVSNLKRSDGDRTSGRHFSFPTSAEFIFFNKDLIIKFLNKKQRHFFYFLNKNFSALSVFGPLFVFILIVQANVLIKLTINLIHIKTTPNMKKVLFIFILVLTAFGTMQAQDYSRLINEAEGLFYQGKFAEASERYEQAFRSGRASDIHLYSAACASARAGNQAKAIEQLRLAIDRGWMAIDPLQRDPDLASLRELPEWTRMIKDLRERVAGIEAGYDRQLVAQLEVIEERDQRYRKEIRALTAQGNTDPAQIKEMELLQAELDAVNLAAIDPIVAQYGYPGKELVGNKCEVVFMVIQNADLETQKHYIPLLDQAANRDDIPWFSYMRFLERIDTQEGRLQLYGATVDRQRWNGQIDVNPGLGSERSAMAGIPGHQRSARWDVDYQSPRPSSNDRR